MAAYFKRLLKTECFRIDYFLKPLHIVRKFSRITFYSIVFSIFYEVYVCHCFFRKQQSMEEACCNLQHFTAMFLCAFLL